MADGAIGGDFGFGGGGGGFGGYDYASLVNAVAPGASPIVPNDTFGSLFSGSGSDSSSQPFGARVDAWLGLDDKTKAGLKSATGDIGKLTGLNQQQQAQQPKMQMPGAPSATLSHGSPPTELLQLIQALQQKKEQQKLAYLSAGYPVRSVSGLLGGGGGG